MDRIGSSSSNNAQSSYEPNACESSPTTPSNHEATATCPDGSLTYDAGICASTGLKGPPTAAQQYVANLSLASSESAQPEALAEAPLAGAKETPRDALQQMVNDAADAATEAVRAALRHGSLETGQKLEVSATLPNGCEAKFSITASMELNAQNRPELVAKVEGSIEAKVGALSAEAAFSYVRGTGGTESLSLGACIFGGVDQNAAALVELEAKAGVCGTFRDSSGTAATFELEAVARAGASLSLGEAWKWGHEVETRALLSRETLPYDMLR